MLSLSARLGASHWKQDAPSLLTTVDGVSVCHLCLLKTLTAVTATIVVMASARDSRGGLRELTRRTVRAEIANKATELFLQHGFDETTIAQIAAAVGTSGRNVFRYFPTKEDMVLADMLEQGYDVASALAARPAGEATWEALRRAFDECLIASRNDGGLALARATMVATTPSLRAASLHRRDQWIDLLYPHVLPRFHGPRGYRELRARAIVSAALACLHTAVDAWTKSAGKQRLDALLDAAFDAVSS
jgi:AcrR family transcriptional regulator